MGEGNRVASVIMFTFTLKPGPHTHNLCEARPHTYNLCEARPPYSRLARALLARWLAKATNPNTTTHNGSQHS